MRVKHARAKFQPRSGRETFLNWGLNGSGVGAGAAQRF